jgi:hypothetical protein
MMPSLVVDRRFNGPPASANGGYTAGALAAACGPAGEVTVQLRMPPPLDVPLDVVPLEGRVELRSGTEVVAVAVPREPGPWPVVEPVPLEVARSLQPSYAGFREHPFPTCFSCGPQHRDGLGIFPGRVDGDRVAASWTPTAPVDRPTTWAALDCAGAWSTELVDRPMVLAQMSARVEAMPQPGTSYAVVGQHVRTEGRKSWTATALFDADGRLVAGAEQLWIAVDPSVLRRLQEE